MALAQCDWHPYKKGNSGHRYAHRRASWEDWKHAARSKELVEARREACSRPFPVPSEGALYFDFGLPASRMCMLSCFSCPQPSATLWTVACQAPLSTDSPGKNTGVGCHALLQGIFPTQGSDPCLSSLLHWQAGSFTTSATWEATQTVILFHGFDRKPIQLIMPVLWMKLTDTEQVI